MQAILVDSQGFSKTIEVRSPLDIIELPWRTKVSESMMRPDTKWGYVMTRRFRLTSFPTGPALLYIETDAIEMVSVTELNDAKAEIKRLRNALNNKEQES